MARDLGQTMDELGFAALWTAKHHFQREGYKAFPNLIQSLWLATQTARLNWGAHSTSSPRGIRCAWRRTTPWPTS